MAYRRSNGKGRSKKIEPAVRTISFEVPAGISYVDLSLCASISNRRFYRQGLNWFVAGMTAFTTSPGTFITSKAPDTWMASNSWEKAYHLWRKMNDQVLDEEPSISGRYQDFKVFLDATMAGQTVQDATNAAGKILTPRDSLGNLTTGDYSEAASPKANWDYSTIQIPNSPGAGVTTEFGLHFIGPDAATKGLVAGYALSRSRPQTEDPNVPTVDGWMTELFDVGNNMEELRDDIQEDNDRPPYPVVEGVTERYAGGATEFPGLQIHDAAIISPTTVGGKTSIPGGNFQCGLIQLNNTTDAVLNLQIHLVAGPHRGYLCQPMQDV